MQSREQYRRVCEKHGLVEEGMDVCHIISRKAGGASHPDNYVLLGGRMNKRLGRFGDHFMCYFVGEGKARLAVEASRKYGNDEGVKYPKGEKTAESLFEEGSRAFSKLFADSKLLRPDPRGAARCAGGPSVDELCRKTQQLQIKGGQGKNDKAAAKA